MATSSELAFKNYQLVRARILADFMTLGGTPCGSGDVYKALDGLGLRLMTGTDKDLTRADGIYDEARRLNDIFCAELTDTRDCPKCGAEVRRLKGNRDRWYHERADWGWRRACKGIDSD